MKQMEVVLRQRPHEYVIQVGKSKEYDVTIPSSPPEIELIIANLLDKQEIYGDELLPLIFHLTGNDVVCLLNVSLLAGAFLYSYDNYRLYELDNLTLEEMDSLSSYNSIALSQSETTLGATSVVSASDINLSLATQMAATLRKYLSSETSVMRLSATAGVTDISVAAPTANHMSLLDSIVNRLANQVYIVLTERGVHWFDGLLADYDNWTLGEMEDYSPKMSLVQSNGNVYMQFKLSPGDFDMSFSSQIGDFLSSITVKPEQSTMSMTSSETEVLQVSDIAMGLKVSDYDNLTLGEMDDRILQSLDGYLSYALIENTLGVIMESFPESGSFDFAFSNWTTENAVLDILLELNAPVGLQTEMTDGIELTYGLELYDDDLLATWDSWTLEAMAEAARIA